MAALDNRLQQVSSRPLRGEGKSLTRSYTDGYELEANPPAKALLNWSPSRGMPKSEKMDEVFSRISLDRFMILQRMRVDSRMATTERARTRELLLC
jgi:hypothetical protein